MDISAEYKLSEQLGLTVNLNNVLNKTHYHTVGTRARGNFYGESRNFRVTLRGKF